MLVDRTRRREDLLELASIRRYVRTTPIVTPGPGEFIERCLWSRTGWAVHKGWAHCTCKPANPPEPTP